MTFATVQPAFAQEPEDPFASWLPAAPLYCAADMDVPRLASLAVLNLQRMPMTAAQIYRLLDAQTRSHTSVADIGQALKGLWRIGLLVRLDELKSYSARAPRPDGPWLFICDTCPRVDAGRG